MNDFDWMMTVIEHAQDIASYKSGSRKFQHTPIDSLRTFLETTPYITQDGNTLAIDIDETINTIIIGPRLTETEIVDIITRAIGHNMNGKVKHCSIASMNEPATHDDWFNVIRQAVKTHEAKNCCTPS